MAQLRLSAPQRRWPPASPHAIPNNPLSSHIIHVGFIIHNRANEDAFWRDVRSSSPGLYRRMRRGFLGTSSNLPGVAGRRVTTMAYGLARRVVGFS